MLLEKYMNFESYGTAEQMFSVPNDRYIEMCKEWEAIEDEIVENKEQYSFVGTGEHEGRMGLHGGKCIARLMQCAKTESEELACLFVAHDFILNVIDGIELSIAQQHIAEVAAANKK